MVDPLGWDNPLPKGVSCCRFEENQTYLVKYRCDRYFFEVVSRMAKTATVNLRGYQRNCGQYIPFSLTAPTEPQSQKIRLHVDKGVNDEYGYVTVQYEVWDRDTQTKVVIGAQDKIKPYLLM